MTITMKQSVNLTMISTLCLTASAWQSTAGFGLSQSQSRSQSHHHPISPQLPQLASALSSPSCLKSTLVDMADIINNEEAEEVLPCYYRIGNRWKQRLQLDELKVGQKLIGKKISTADLLDTKTGPKVFFECGIGRIDGKGRWQMVSGMARVAKNFSKPKIVKKKIQRLSNKEVEVYVHKIRLSEGRLEVCTSLEELEREIEKNEKRVEEGKEMVPVSSLQAGQDVVGKVVEVRPYGVMVDVGANRNGLLHIQQVADLYRRYIDKEEGLIEAGLERGAEVRLRVSSIERKRLFLEFTQDTMDAAAEEAAMMEAEAKAEEEAATKAAEEAKMKEALQSETDESEDENDVDQSNGYDEEAAAWAAYGNDYADEEDDEDADIEDALGISSY